MNAKHWLNDWEDHDDNVMSNLITKNKQEAKRMTTETLEPVSQNIIDLFDGELEIQKDKAPKETVDGKYIARVDSLVRYTGESEKCFSGQYDFFSLVLAVEEVISGDNVGVGKKISDTYANVDGAFIDKKTGEERPIPALPQQRKLMNFIHTAALKYTHPENASDRAEFFGLIAPDLKDQLVNVVAWTKKSGKQGMKIVDQFEGIGVNKEATSSDDL